MNGLTRGVVGERRSVKFVKCDVTLWTDQLAVFKEAIASSPAHRVDIVVANAGISGADAIYFNNGESSSPPAARTSGQIRLFALMMPCSGTGRT